MYEMQHRRNRKELGLRTEHARLRDERLLEVRMKKDSGSDWEEEVPRSETRSGDTRVRLGRGRKRSTISRSDKADRLCYRVTGRDRNRRQTASQSVDRLVWVG
jgi:hypothetical protein